MFSLDGKLYKLMTWFYLCLLLNLLYLASCLLLVTIPPATAGLFAVARKLVKREEPPILRTFWQGARENWRQSWAVAGVFLAIGLIVSVDFHAMQVAHSQFAGAELVLLALVTLVAASTLLHLFPLMVHVEQTTRQLFVNALKLNLVKPFWSLFNLVAIGILLLISLQFSYLLFILYFSLSALITYWCVDQKFKVVLATRGPAADAVDLPPSGGADDPQSGPRQPDDSN